MEIDVEKLKRMQMLHVAFVLIDIRTQDQFDKGHIKGAVNIPSNDFLNVLPSRYSQKETAIVIYDEDGNLSPDLVTKAEKLGYLNIVYLEGGFNKF